MKDIKIVPAGQASNVSDEKIYVVIGVKGKEETFKVESFLPGIFILDMMAAQASADSDEAAGKGMLEAVTNMFPVIFKGDEFSRFRAYLSDPTNKIDFEDIMDIFNQIIAIYSDDRPTNG